MALRDQPYLPLYVQDVLTDEKLIECSASAHGVYLRLLCILHKQDEYGVVCLKQKYKQNESKFTNFASMLARQMPFGEQTIGDSLEELCREKVITVTEDSLFQKRMVKDGQLSLIRAEQGKKGGNGVSKQYGVAGFLYLMGGLYCKHKIGISSNPTNRLYRVRSDRSMPKQFGLIKTYSVTDMGKAEDVAQEFFNVERDGEWLNGEHEDLVSKFDLLESILEANHLANTEAKVQAKAVANTEYEYEDENRDIIDYLNSKTGKKYRCNVAKTKSVISARLKEGFTVCDFKDVINNKCADWLGNADMEKFLRPETLFGNKFEGYLNQKCSARQSTITETSKGVFKI